MAGDNDGLYEYSVISDPDTIRLIELQPSPSLETPIRCALHHKSLEEIDYDIFAHYIALSYVWGDASDQCTISVDGKALKITASLESALRHIRDSTRVINVWADGVCINQKDVRDRNMQVELMSSIYSLAHHTIIFLGHSTPEIDVALTSISQMTRSESSAFGGRQQFDQVIKEQVISRPWFSRVWILQELVLSSNPWIQAGSIRIRWKYLCRYTLTGSAKYQSSPNCQRIRGMNDIKIKYQQSIDENGSSIQMLFDILKYRRGLGVTDPRDMIYGHLGLCAPTVRSSLSIDYSLSVSQLYQEAASQIIAFTKNLSILSYVEQIQPDDRRPDLPSWVPDWATPSTPDPSLEYLEPSSAKWNFGMTVSISNALLIAIGRHRGTIAILATSGKFPGLRPSMTPAGVLECLISPPYDSSSRPILTNFINMCNASALHIGAEAREENLDSIDKNWDPFYPTPTVIASLVYLLRITFALSPDTAPIFRDLDSESWLATYLVSMLCRRIRTIGDCSSSGENVAITTTDFVICVSGMAREGDILCNLHGRYGSEDDSYSGFVIVRPSAGQNQEPKTESREPGSMPLNLTLQAGWVEEGMRVIYCRFVTCQMDQWTQSVYPSHMINEIDVSRYRPGEDVVFAIY